MKYESLLAERAQKVIYKDGNRVVKLFDVSFPQSDILNEALNQSRVQEAGLSVPKVHEVVQIDGKWAIVMDYVEGKTLAKIGEENPKDFNKYFEKFIDLQIEVQSKRVPLLNKLKDKMRRKINESGLDATTRYELNSRLSAMPRHVKVCHGDFNPENIIIGPDGKATIIDWSHVTQGNASADVARTYLLFKLQKQDDIAEKYLKRYCDKTDTAIQYVKQWLPIVAASQSVKGLPEEREFLLKWVDIMDFE